MPGADAFQVEGVVLSVLSERACRLRLANGHELVGHLTRRSRAALGEPQPGQRWTVQLSPYDLSEGRLVGVRRNQ
jgi:translation initiation factor IF-1